LLEKVYHGSCWSWRLYIVARLRPQGFVSFDGESGAHPNLRACFAGFTGASAYRGFQCLACGGFTRSERILCGRVRVAYCGRAPACVSWEACFSCSMQHLVASVRASARKCAGVPLRSFRRERRRCCRNSGKRFLSVPSSGLFFFFASEWIKHQAGELKLRP
jgi:hypothetical protein